jgi:hypothetical protein
VIFVMRPKKPRTHSAQRILCLFTPPSLIVQLMPIVHWVAIDAHVECCTAKIKIRKLPSPTFCRSHLVEAASRRMLSGPSERDGL